MRFLIQGGNTRESVLVMRAQFRSRDKMASHRSIRRSGKPHAVRKLRGCMFYRTGVIVDGICTLREQEFSTFGSCDLDLDPMTFIHEPDLYPLETHRMCKSERPTSRLSKVIV